MCFPLMKNIDPNVLKFSFGGQLSGDSCHNCHLVWINVIFYLNFKGNMQENVLPTK
jgi:hypothetical protein